MKSWLSFMCVKKLNFVLYFLPQKHVIIPSSVDSFSSFSFRFLYAYYCWALFFMSKSKYLLIDRKIGYLGFYMVTRISVKLSWRANFGSILSFEVMH